MLHAITAHPTAQRVLETAIAAADHTSVDALAATIAAHHWHGDTEDPANTAVGNYLAEEALAAAVAPALHTIVWGGTAYLVNSRTRHFLAVAPLSGALAELHERIEDEEPGYAHLHDPAEIEPEPGNATDAAEADAAAFELGLTLAGRTSPLLGAAADDDPAFFDRISLLRATLA